MSSYAPEIFDNLDHCGKLLVLRGSFAGSEADTPWQSPDLNHMVSKYDDGCSLHDYCETCPFPDCRYGWRKEIEARSHPNPLK